MHRIIILFFLCLNYVITISCNQTENKKQQGSTIKEEGRKILDEAEILRLIEKGIGIATIQNGVNGLQFRIWGSEKRLINTSRLVVFDSVNNKWSGRMCMVEFVPRTGPEVKIANHYWRSLSQPKSGWNGFIKKMYALGILNLPEMKEVPGYNESLNTDEYGYTFEIAQNKIYRNYTYLSPFSRQDNFKELKSVTEILNLIESEFSLP